ncbi:MAG: hypothetical protein AB7J46_01740 [Candidatus Altimarinota bacterium]
MSNLEKGKFEDDDYEKRSEAPPDLGGTEIDQTKTETKFKTLKNSETPELLDKIRTGKIPDSILIPHLETTDFADAYFNHLLQSHDELRKFLQENPGYKEQFLKDTGLRRELYKQHKERYIPQHVEKKSEIFAQRLEQQIEQGVIPDSILIPHLEADEFVGQYFDFVAAQDADYQKESSEHADQDLRGKVMKKLRKVLYKKHKEQYEPQHVEKKAISFAEKFTQAVENGKIPEDILETHYEADDFANKYFDAIAANDVDFQKELSQHPELDLRGKVIQQKSLRRALLTKHRREYEPAHVKKVSERLSKGLSSEIEAASADEFLDQDLSNEELKKAIFQKVAMNNSDLQKEKSQHQDQNVEEQVFQEANIQAALQRKINQLETVKVDRLKTQIEAAVKEIEFTNSEKKNDEFHGNEEAFTAHFRNRMPAELLRKIEKLQAGDQVEAFLKNQLSKVLYPRWLGEHEKAEVKEKEEAMLQQANEAIPESVLQQDDLNEADFFEAYFQVLANRDTELKEKKHENILKQLKSSERIHQAIKSRHREYLDSKSDQIVEKISVEMESITFSDQEIKNDAFHEKPDDFARYILDEKLTKDQKSKLEKLSPEKRSQAERNLLGIAKDKLYQKWKQQHEEAEKNEKTQALLQAAKVQTIPSDLSKENLTSEQFFEKFFNVLADQGDELKDPKHQQLREELKKNNQLNSAISARYAEYQDSAANRLATGLESEVESVSFTEEEYKEEKYHDNPEEFGKFVISKKLSAKLLEQLDFLGDKKKEEILSRLSKHARTKLYSDWKKEHEKREKEEAKTTLRDLIRDRNEIHTPKGMKDEFASEEDFKKAMWQDALNQGKKLNKEWQEPEHAQMIASLSNDPEMDAALSDRYAFYKEKFQAEAQKELQTALKFLDFSGEIENDEFHNNRDAFAAEMLKKLPAALRKKMGPFKALQDLASEQLKGTIYDQWLKQHETAEDNKFTEELEKTILAKDIPDSFAQKHYEKDEFQAAWFEHIKGSLSDDLLKEHPEAIQKLLAKARIQKAFSEKFEAYEEKHDKAMEVKFSEELSTLLSTASIPPEMIQKHFSEDHFTKDWFEMVLRNASPELLEELQEHPGLKEKLFKHQKVQGSLKNSYESYEKQHDQYMEKKFSEELTVSLSAFKIPPEMLASPLNEAQFSDELMAKMFKNASPELQEELKEHADLKAKLMGHAKVKGELAKKYDEYQKMLKPKPEQKEKEEEKMKQAKLEKKQGVAATAEQAGSTKDKKAKKTGASAKGKKKMTAAELEQAKDGDLSRGLDKVVDMSKGQARLLELKKLPFLRNVLRKDHMKRFLEPFIVEWSAQIKDSEFRLFKMSLMKRGMTPQKMIQLMTMKPERQRAIKRIKNFSSRTWLKFSQGSRMYLNIQSNDVLQLNMKLKEEASQQLEVELEETPVIPEASLFQMEEGEMEEIQEQEDMEIGSDLDDPQETDELVQAEVMEPLETIDEFLELDEAFDADPIEDLSEDSEAVQQQVELDEELEQLPTEEALPIEPVEAAFEEFQEHQASTNETNAEFEVQPQPPLEMDQATEELEEAADPSPLEPEEIAIDPVLEEDQNAPEQFLEPLESEEEVMPEEVQDEPVVSAFEDPASDEASEQPVDELMTDEPSESLQKEEVETEEAAEIELSSPPDEEEMVVKELKAQEVAASEPNNESTHLKPSPKIEAVNPRSLEAKKREEEEQDPLRELEKFRRQMMRQFKRSARLTQLQKTYELLGVNIEPFYELPEEESSEFLETLRIEMETHSISLGNLLQKFVRYVKFISDFEIPTQYQIPSSVLERLVKNPGEVFKALNNYYFECRDRHEKTTEFTFSMRSSIRLSDDQADLIFEVHKNEVQEVCAAFIPCLLVEEEEKKIPVHA